jgi:hypothetical protein
LNVNDVSNLSLGLPQANGNWTGLLGELQHKHMHVIPQLLMDNSRRNVADFSQPFAMLGYVIFIIPLNQAIVMELKEWYSSICAVFPLL